MRDFGQKVEEKFHEARPRIEGEFRRAVACLNDEVVPDVRKNSSRALRAAAGQLSRFAAFLERGASAGGRD